MTEWLEDDDATCVDAERWPMAPTHLLPRERWLWWEQLWADVIMLGDCYRVRPGKDWWEDAVAVEALAALAAWVARCDAGEWDDPPGKLALLYDLERVRELMQGSDPFDPGRDRAAFCRLLADSGCQPSPGTQAPARRHRR